MTGSKKQNIKKQCSFSSFRSRTERNNINPKGWFHIYMCHLPQVCPNGETTKGGGGGVYSVKLSLQNLPFL